MGIGDFFKKTFGKQTCAFCGKEVGMMGRDKIKNDEFICSDCKRTCSRYIQVYRLTKDELLDHMEKVFGECGVKLTLVGGMDDLSRMPKGLRAHPYITQEITIKVNDRDKHIGMMDVQHVIGHFDYIFGVGDDTKGLFSFGPTKQQRREGEAFKAMTGMFGAAIKAARTGEVPEDAKAQVEKAMSKVDDATTSGLAKYTRLADAAEEKVYGED